MAFVFTYKTTSYRFIQQGIVKIENYTQGLMGILLAFIAFPLLAILEVDGWNFLIALVVAVVVGFCVSVGITLGITRLRPVQKLLYRQKLIAWNSIAEAEMKGNQVKILANPEQKVGRLGNPHFQYKESFTITKDREAEMQQLFSQILSDRFTIL